ncbi:MAG: MurT ligase domain-containing protein [Actinomycetaceae bacterium]|nr:MurT ligase domain-containing protein [Actinomycetaceae bacterium]
MRSRLTVALGRAARLVARRRGSGTAFPGLVVERVDPGFLARALGGLPGGVVVVSGTNGKTTTTKMVVHLLREQGLKVFTNRTGSNFVRGVLAALVAEVDAAGRLDADVAVLELDEAHAVHFVAQVRPRACLLLNVMRDQLDRFGEIDYTAALLGRVAEATREVVVVNADDSRLAAPAFLEQVTARTASFGVGTELRSIFPSDDELRAGLGGAGDRRGGGAGGSAGGAGMAADGGSAGGAGGTGAASQSVARVGTGADAGFGEPSRTDVGRGSRASPGTRPRVTLESIKRQSATVRVDGVDHEVAFAIPGVHNLLNACAALELVVEILGDDAELPALLAALSGVEAAFGREESLTLDGRPILLSLVKNPAGFRMGLLSAAAQAKGERASADEADGRPVLNVQSAESGPASDASPGAIRQARVGEAIMVAINDEYADGRDMSWLWDVDLEVLRECGVAVVTGVRAWDMALRLQYDDVCVRAVEPDLRRAVSLLREEALRTRRPMRVFATYTAMLSLRSILSEITDVEEAMP